MAGGPLSDTPRIRSGQTYECATFTCRHCQRVVVINPLRTRERGYCGKCDHYLCDECELTRVLTGECRDFERVIEQVQNAAAKGILTNG